MKPTAKRGIAALLALLILLPLLLIMLVDQKKQVRTNDISATQAADPVEFQIDYKEIPTTTEAPTTTTTTTIPPTTTTEYIPPTTTTVAPAPPREADSDGVNWDAIAQCESGGDWHINTGNGYYGGLQFSYSTWLNYGGGRYSEYAHQTSRENQIAIASTMSLSHWPNCGRYG